MPKQAPLGIALHLKKRRPPEITEIEFAGTIEVLREAPKADFIIFIEEKISEITYREFTDVLLDQGLRLPRVNPGTLLKPIGFIRLEHVLVCKIRGSFRFFDLDSYEPKNIPRLKKQKSRTLK